MTTLITLIDVDENPNGRQLIQVRDSIYVTSECCAGKITEGRPYHLCYSCNVPLVRNGGWDSSISGLSTWKGFPIPSSIPNWLEFWFGMEKMRMEIE